MIMQTTPMPLAVKLLALLYALFALTTGVADAFTDISALNELIFHSGTFHVALFAIFATVAWVAAVLFEKRRKKRLTDSRNN